MNPNTSAIKMPKPRTSAFKNVTSDLRKQVLMKLRDKDNRSKSATSGNCSGNSSSSKTKKSKKTVSRSPSNRDKNSSGSLFS